MEASQRSGRRVTYAVIAMFLLLATGIVVAGNRYYRNYKRHYRAEVGRQLSAIAELKTAELVDWRQERLKDANSFYRNAAFSALVRRLSESPEDADAQRQLQSWIGKFGVSHQYVGVFLLDTQGVVLAAAPELKEPVSAHLLQDASESLGSGQVVFLDFHRSAPDRPIHLTLLVPVIDEQAGDRPLGVLVLRIDPQTYLYPFIKRWPTPSETAETLIVRRDGDDALFLNDLKFHKDSALNLHFPLAKSEVPAVKAVLGREGIVEGPDYRGVPVIAAVRRVPDSPWFLVARIDVSEVYAPVTKRLWQTVAFFGLLLLAGGTGLGSVWRNRRARFYRERYRLTEALQAQLDFAQSLIDTAQAIVLVFDTEGRVVRFNPYFEKLSGYSLEEVQGRDWFSTFLPENVRQSTRDLFSRAIGGVQTRGNVSPLLTKDGRLLEIEWYDKTLRDAEGRITGLLSIGQDVTERKRVEETLKESELYYRELLNSTADAIFVHDVPSGKIIDCNIRAYQSLGYSREELLRLSVRDIDASFSTEQDVTAWDGLQPGMTALLSGFHRRKDRSLLPVEVSVSIIASAGRNMAIAVARDVSERKNAEEELRRTNRALRAITACNEVLVRAVEESPLLDDICRLIVEIGGYCLAWVGFAEQDAGKTVRPAAHAGKENGYLKAARISWADDEWGRGPTGIAIRSGKPVAVSDIQTEPHYAPWWRAEGEKRGLRSSVALPLVVGGDAIGALNVYSESPNAFSAEEIKLLTELANDLAYGIRSLRVRAARIRAEEDLHFQNILLSTQQEASLDGILIVDENGKVLEANGQFARMWGIPPQVMGRGSDDAAVMTALDAMAVPEEFLDRVKYLYSHRTETSHDEIVLKDARTFDRYSAPMLGADGKYHGRVWYFRDVTERKRAEEVLRTAAEETRAMMNRTVEAISGILEVRDPYTAGHERRVSQLACAMAGALGWDEERVEGIRIAGYMHDIGKVAVPAEILSKPGRISELEMGLIMSHPQCGYDILNKIAFTWPVAMATLQHHERLDGSGYPQQLEGEQIIPEARLLAIADVVEAMSSHRPYRAARTVEAALEEVTQKPHLYDRDMAEACRRLFMEEGFQLT